MREIKFRVFNTKEKIMVTHFNGARIDYVLNYWETHKYVSTPMQYTELKDKNGVEVYEGDIVKTNATNAFVYFDKCCFWIEGKNQAKSPIYQFHHYLFEDDFFEVIGNIYENPELLEK